MDTFIPWVGGGVLVGAFLGFHFQAQSHLRPSQSRLGWILSLVLSRAGRTLALVAATILLGATVGGLLGATVYLGFDAAAR